MSARWKFLTPVALAAFGFLVSPLPFGDAVGNWMLGAGAVAFVFWGEITHRCPLKRVPRGE
jgi:hypothetical protein